MRLTYRSLGWVMGVGLLVGACSAQSEGGKSGSGGATGTGGSTAGSGGSIGTGGSSGTGGSASGGSTGSGGSSIDAPVAGGDGSVDQPASGDGGPVATAGCAANKYPVCIDFETPMPAGWTGVGTNVQMDPTKAAHGNAAFHGPPSSTISTTNLGAITNVVWGRFYLHMTPKAPVGHGAMVMLFDQPGRTGNWYEVGFEYNALQGNWHGNGGERYMHTRVPLPDKWVCVEFFADGANAAPIKLWMDGMALSYPDGASSPTILKTTKFANFTIGLTPYHGLSTVTYEGNTMPMTDMWIDDIALDTQRIGCIN